MLQPPCGWRTIHANGLTPQACQCKSHHGLRMDNAEAWTAHLPAPRCVPLEPGMQQPWHFAMPGSLEADADVSRLDGRLCNNVDSVWNQCPRDSHRLAGWQTHLRCRANSNGCNKCSAQTAGWDGGARNAYTDQRSSQHSAALRLKALELEHEELRRQLELQQLPQRQDRSCRPNTCQDGHSCGSRCSGPTKSRSRSACGAQSQHAERSLTHRDGQQGRLYSGREMLHERGCEFNGPLSPQASSVQRSKVDPAKFVTKGQAKERRTQNSEMVGSGRSVHNGFSTHAVDKYVQHAPHADKSHLQKLGSSGWTHDGFDQRYGTFQDTQHVRQQEMPITRTDGLMPDLRQMPRAVCPTPYALGSVCGRGERELPGWRSIKDSKEILGNCAEILNSTCKYIFDVLSGTEGWSGSLKILSAADGCADDMLQEAQARYVPTSVMLAHAFASSAGAWSDYRTKIRVYGGDVRNPVTPFWQPQALPWQLPVYLDHRFIFLDNTQDFGSQLYRHGQCEVGQLFDVVLLRQGLCFCDDPSKTSTAWPLEVSLSCTSCENCRAALSSEQLQAQEPAVVRVTAICGVYRLEPFLCENRPAYRLGRCVLRWCPDRLEWAVLDDADGGAWAFARGDLGHPTLSRGPWTVWDGQNHVADASFACNLVQPAASPPWHLLPTQRMVCAGVTGDVESIIRFLHRIAAILDTSRPDSFGLLHGAWTNGTQVEVEQLHRQLMEAAQVYNDRRRAAGGLPLHAACVLWRTAATQYWLQCDGIVLFQPGSAADPYRAYGAAPIL